MFSEDLTLILESRVTKVTYTTVSVTTDKAVSSSAHQRFSSKGPVGAIGLCDRRKFWLLFSFIRDVRSTYKGTMPKEFLGFRQPHSLQPHHQQRVHGSHHTVGDTLVADAHRSGLRGGTSHMRHVTTARASGPVVTVDRRSILCTGWCARLPPRPRRQLLSSCS